MQKIYLLVLGLTAVYILLFYYYVYCKCYNEFTAHIPVQKPSCELMTCFISEQTGKLKISLGGSILFGLKECIWVNKEELSRN